MIELTEDQQLDALGRAAAAWCDAMMALGFDPDIIARSLLIESVGLGRAATSADAWIDRLSQAATVIAKHSAEGQG